MHHRVLALHRRVLSMEAHVSLLLDRHPAPSRLARGGLRLLGAALDAVALAAIAVLIGWAYLWNRPVDGTIAPAPAWYLPLVGVVWAGYLTVGSWRGATPGMLAVGLRV